MQHRRLLQHLERHEALLLVRAFDDQGSNIRRRLIHGVLHYFLQSLRGRAAPVAVRVKPQPDGAVLNAQQFHFALMRTQAHARFIQRLSDARFEISG